MGTVTAKKNINTVAIKPPDAMISTVEDQEEFHFEFVESTLEGHVMNGVDDLYDDHGDLLHDWIEEVHFDEAGNFNPAQNESLGRIALLAAQHAAVHNKTIRGKISDLCENSHQEEMALAYLGQRGTNNGEND